MHLIAALVTERAARARLEAAARGLAELRFASTVGELTRLVVDPDVAAVIAELRDARNESVLPTVARCRDRFPSIPVLVYLALTPADVRDLPAAARAGAGAVMLKGLDDLPGTVAGVLARALAARTGDEIARRVAWCVPAAVRPVLAVCAAQARGPLTVADVAAALGLHRRTLAGRMRRAGMMTPAALITWCRLLHAMRLLDDPGRSVARVAAVLGFPSASALHNVIRRYLGAPPSALRRDGGFDAAVQRFAHALGAPAAGLSADPPRHPESHSPSSS